MPRDDLYLVEIVEACRLVTRFMADLDQERFLDDELVKNAVAYQLFVVGEAAGAVRPELRARHPAVPWTQWRGLRNALAHTYFGVRWPDVWATARDDVPQLESSILTILDVEFPNLARRLRHLA